jgi:hypothetical protein
VFVWFVGIGALTVAMSGGIARRPRRPKPVPEPEPEADEGFLDEDAPVEETPAAGDLAAAAPLDADDVEDHFVADDDATAGTRDAEKLKDD